jgi:calmodulin
MVEKLTQDQISEIKEAFCLFQEDQDGKIPNNMLGHVFRTLGMNPTEVELNEMIKEIDTEGSGNFGISELLNIMAIKMKDDDLENELIQAFQELDRDGDGLISIAELRNMMSELGKKLVCSEVEEPIKEANFDCDEYINLESFLKIIKG